MQLTGPNRSYFSQQTHAQKSATLTSQNAPTATLSQKTGWAGRPGGHCEGPTPDPIPNSAVKSLSAYDTAP
ncbi:hypothetical protein AA103587_1119 [Gluconobacter kanchanaburiensis NBRC 103587]|nr:hypothetical protein AA103587_1119 [Gluconobacter kanchanaburiensis NBRC 103587]